MLTTLASKYRIEVKEEPEFAGETFEERHARITVSNEGLTFEVSDFRVPVLLWILRIFF
jgi:hypothetical protein